MKVRECDNNGNKVLPGLRSTQDYRYSVGVLPIIFISLTAISAHAQYQIVLVYQLVSACSMRNLLSW
jgi:hypothetical protein